MKLKMTEKEAEEQLKHGYAKARDLLNDDEKVEKFLQKLEHKMKLIPKIGDKLTPFRAQAISMTPQWHSSAGTSSAMM